MEACRSGGAVDHPDGIWVSAGSTNFDDRSFHRNDEANSNAPDAGFTAALAETFERDRTASRPISLDEWRRRLSRQKLLESALALFRSQI